MKFLVVGAGFAGAVHARVLAEAGHDVLIIDRRQHIAGNAYDFIDENGIRVHKYGPHLFHTSNETVVRWIEQFGEFVPYEHRAFARLGDGTLVDFPVNRRTLAQVLGFDVESESAMHEAIERDRIRCARPTNAAEFLYDSIGRTITDLFFRPYTTKMWGEKLEDIPAEIVKRVAIRMDFEDRYFPNDTFQIMPRKGYTALFEAILAHPRINLRLNEPFDRAMEKDYDHVFNSMAIDEYFDFEFGELPYRSIRFDQVCLPRDQAPSRAVVNYTDHRPQTRETWWHILPHHDNARQSLVTRTTETPCDYKQNNDERYYPVKTADNRHEKTYGLYKDKAEKITNVTFIGRCGTYQYLDMHQVINQSLASASKHIKAK